MNAERASVTSRSSRREQSVSLCQCRERRVRGARSGRPARSFGLYADFIRETDYRARARLSPRGRARGGSAARTSSHRTGRCCSRFVDGDPAAIGGVRPSTPRSPRRRACTSSPSTAPPASASRCASRLEAIAARAVAAIATRLDTSDYLTPRLRPLPLRRLSRGRPTTTAIRKPISGSTSVKRPGLIKRT